MGVHISGNVEFGTHRMLTISVYMVLYMVVTGDSECHKCDCVVTQDIMIVFVVQGRCPGVYFSCGVVIVVAASQSAIGGSLLTTPLLPAGGYMGKVCYLSPQKRW